MPISFSRLFVVLSILLLVAIQSRADSLSSLAGRFESEQPEKRAEIIKELRDVLRIPYYYSFPAQNFLAMPSNVIDPPATKSPNPAILVNLPTTADSRRPENQAGLRLLVVDGARPRAATAATIADTGLLEDGDILLSFRPEWYGTLRYSHIQLGVSHAAIGYVSKGADGLLRIRNLDMPMDGATVGPSGQSTLSSKHYLEAPYINVLRPRGMTEAQRRNVGAWVRLLVKNGRPAFLQKKLRFNKDYASPNYREGQPLGFVANLGRIALGQKMDVASLGMYCSEFAWSVLSLRDCDPAATKNQFASSGTVPGCIKPIFQPMPVLGAAREDVVGMIDGPALLLQQILPANTGHKIQESMIHRIFSLANGAPEHISEGHRAVEDAVLGQNPQFYGLLEKYYNATFVGTAAMQDPMMKAIVQGFNASQFPNYSPTAFQVHAVMPDYYASKAFDYVMTLAYVPHATYLKVKAATAGHR